MDALDRLREKLNGGNTVDPNETLRQIRLYAKQLHVDTDPCVRAAHAELLAENVEALDEWITGGGFLPADWEEV